MPRSMINRVRDNAELINEVGIDYIRAEFGSVYNYAIRELADPPLAHMLACLFDEA